jgi:Na+/H+ antiporter NhaD/arsenite permease-like protein
MNFLIIIIFILGYLVIAFEQPLKLNKAASALITGVLCWVVYVFQKGAFNNTNEILLNSFGEISSILFFLLSAMTIVELIDLHDGFDIISEKITTNSKRKLLLIVTSLTYFLSAFLNNLTTAIVMMSLCAKLLNQKEDRLLFAGMIVIAANAGGVWSPLGDVTTTMLWIGGQVTAMHIMKELIVPSLAVCFIPALILGYRFRGQSIPPLPQIDSSKTEKRNGRIILFSGMGFLFFVPAFKSLTGLPPFMGMLLALGCMWVITTILHKEKSSDYAERFTVARALEKIDASSILFFLGILLAVSALQIAGILHEFSNFLNIHLHNIYFIGTALGLLSSIVDNVPLVAASQGMYNLSAYPPDHSFWGFLALTTGTGGSIIIIGSAAGVAVMGIEHINFSWYIKKISLLAIIGFLAGIIVFLIQTKFI